MTRSIEIDGATTLVILSKRGQRKRFALYTHGDDAMERAVTAVRNERYDRAVIHFLGREPGVDGYVSTGTATLKMAKETPR